MRRRLGWTERLRPLTMMAGSALAGHDFVAVHMIWWAINEWTTQAGYAQLTRRADHPLLSERLHRIMRQEGRHIDFDTSQAHHRLAASRRARRLTRFALSQFWSPVGSGVMPAAETEHLARFLMGCPGWPVSSCWTDRSDLYTPTPPHPRPAAWRPDQAQSGEPRASSDHPPRANYRPGLSAGLD